MPSHISSIFTGLLLLLSSFPLLGVPTGDGPKVGDSAPPLHLAKLLNAADGAKAEWAALKGKWVVLEFWQTTCPPCILSIPRLNEMVAACQNDPIQFISITDEGEETVTKFLKNNPFKGRTDIPKDVQPQLDSLDRAYATGNPIKGWVGLDQVEHDVGNTFSGFYLSGVPHTFVVDPTGRIAVITHPFCLSTQFLKDLMAGKQPPLPEPDLPPNQIATFKKADAEYSAQQVSREYPPVLQFSIKRSKEWQSPSPAFRISYQGLETERLPWLEVIAKLYGVLPNQVELQAELPKTLYDFKILLPSEVRFLMFQEALETQFGLNVRRAGDKIIVKKADKAPNL